MDYLKYSVKVDKGDLDRLIDTLVMWDIDSFEVLDPDGFDEVLSSSIYYDYVDEELKDIANSTAGVRLYIPKNEQGSEMLFRAKQALAHVQAPYSIVSEDIDEEDWANNWKKYFKPIEVGKNIVIKPSWEELPKTCTRTVLEIDPSVSFGTGTHATTRLCIEAIEQFVAPDMDFLDMGCGSGILTVAALLMGAKRSVSVDIDEIAIEVTEKNIQRNGLDTARAQLLSGNVMEDAALLRGIGQECYDVVAANIVSDVIIAMAGLLHGFLRAGGTLIASGIIEEREAEVSGALERAGFRISDIRREEDWCAIIAVKE